MKKRYDFLDLYKGIAIILILVHHVFQYFVPLEFIVDYVTDFHVAMFFLASGIVLALSNSKVNLKSFTAGRIRRLIVPYLIFAAVGAILKLGVLLLQGQLTKAILQEEMWQILTIGNGPVWFLYRLFFVEMVFALAYRIGCYWYGRFGQLIIQMLTILIIVCTQHTEGYLVSVVRSTCMGYQYLIIGYIIGHQFSGFLDEFKGLTAAAGGGWIARDWHLHQCNQRYGKQLENGIV